MFSYYSRSKKTLSFLLVFLVGLSLGLFIEWRYIADKMTPIEPVTVNLTIRSTINEIVDFQNLKAIPGSSVFNLMNNLVESGKINWEIKQKDDGSYINALFEKKNQDQGESWRCFINNQPCQTSLEKLKLQGQEHIEWKYEK